MKLRSYANLYALGHAAIQDLFKDPVLVEEKIDGSQFSFGVSDGELICKSKGKDQTPPLTDGLFKLAVDKCNKVLSQMTEGWVYRAEYLAKPKHNTLAYNRTPDNNLIIFDINTGLETYMNYNDKAAEAKRLGFECVPIIDEGLFESYDTFQKMLSTPSCLGGQTIEGVVVKNYSRFDKGGKALMGKYVNESFKEVHQKDWKHRNPTSGDVVQLLIEELKTPARWSKAIQHLRDRGTLTNTPKDIGDLIKEVRDDIDAECAEYIKSKLYNLAKDGIMRGVTRGLPEWYKEQLAKSQFEGE